MNVKEFYKVVNGNYDEVYSQLGDEDFIVELLKKFISKDEVGKLKSCIINKKYNDAFICAHDIKGYGLNMALPDLHKSADKICEPLRDGKIPKIDMMPLFLELESVYNKIKAAVIQL